MKNLKLTLAFALTFLVSLSFAQEQPYFIIEESGDNYEMLLKVDDVDNVSEVNITGYYIKDAQMKKIDVQIANNQVEQLIENVAQVHQLDGDAEYAVYTVSIKDKQGILNTYPSVEVTVAQDDLAKL